MVTFTWAPAAAGTFDWNTPADWSPAGVPNSTTADVIVPNITNAYGDRDVATVNITAGENYVINTLTLDQEMSIAGTLTVDSTLELAQYGELQLSGSLIVGNFNNAPGQYIQGYGSIVTVGSFDNRAMILGSGLSITTATFTNDGVLNASEGTVTINTGSGAGTFTNLSNGVLTGGTYSVLSGGVLRLNVGGPIVTDAADIVFSGNSAPGPVFETALNDNAIAISLSQSLANITSSGSLFLDDSIFSSSNTLAVDGIVQIYGLQNSTLALAELKVDVDGVVGGNGTVIGSIINNGTIIAGGTLADALGEQYDQGLLLVGAVSGNGIAEISSAGTIFQGSFPFNTLEVGSSFTGGVVFQNWNGVLLIDNFASFSGEISGFSTGSDTLYPGGLSGIKVYLASDTITLKGIDYSSISSVSYVGTTAAGTLEIGTGNGTVALDFDGDYSVSDFTLAAGPQALSSTPPSLEITKTLPCFVTGTGIMTNNGEVVVEQLSIGDFVTTAGGNSSRIRWIGRRTVDCSRHHRPWDIWPICIKHGAFGSGFPHRDLWLSPDHSLLIRGRLIPARYLINDVTIQQVQKRKVTYWHIELDRHDVVIANGLPCESYLDTGNRADFENGGHVTKMHPEFALRVWQEKAYAPLVLSGPDLKAARRSLLDRAQALGHSLTDEPSLHLKLGSEELRPVVFGRVYQFLLPENVDKVWLASRCAIPARVGEESNDHRRLGVAVSHIWIDGRAASLDSPALGSGWHDSEGKWRWTDGEAGLALGGARNLLVEVVITERYWKDNPVSARPHSKPSTKKRHKFS